METSEIQKFSKIMDALLAARKSRFMGSWKIGVFWGIIQQVSVEFSRIKFRQNIWNEIVYRINRET
jgi:hypothetical protein